MLKMFEKKEKKRKENASSNGIFLIVVYQFL